MVPDGGACSKGVLWLRGFSAVFTGGLERERACLARKHGLSVCASLIHRRIEIVVTVQGSIRWT